MNLVPLLLVALACCAPPDLVAVQVSALTEPAPTPVCQHADPYDFCCCFFDPTVVNHCERWQNVTLLGPCA